jgi:hypothetical protein
MWTYVLLCAYVVKAYADYVTFRIHRTHRFFTT